MHSWVFRNHQRLAAIYRRRERGAWREAPRQDRIASLREGLRVHVLVPEPPRNLRTAGG